MELPPRETDKYKKQKLYIPTEFTGIDVDADGFIYATNIDEMITRTKYDIIYIENMSLLIDIKIIIYTIKTVFTGKGL